MNTGSGDWSPEGAEVLGLGLGATLGETRWVEEILMERPSKSKVSWVMSLSLSPIQEETGHTAGDLGSRMAWGFRTKPYGNPKEPKSQAEPEQSTHEESKSKKRKARLNAVNRTPITPQVTSQAFQSYRDQLTCRCRQAHEPRKC